MNLLFWHWLSNRVTKIHCELYLNENNKGNKLLQILIKTNLSPKIIITKHRLNRLSFEYVIIKSPNNGIVEEEDIYFKEIIGDILVDIVTSKENKIETRNSDNEEFIEEWRLYKKSPTIP